jgi:integrase
MGDIVRRGTRDNPKFYVRYVDADGTRRMKLAKGADTRGEAVKILRAAEGRVQQGLLGVPDPDASAPRCGPLMDTWLDTLANRNARDDRTRFKRHVLREFRDRVLADVQQIAPVMAWLDRQRKTGEISDASIRHNLNLLSRFFSWAIERGHAEVNPVRMIPTGKRPKQASKKDLPWIANDRVVVALMKAMAEPVNLMFYLGNRSGLRIGEVAGLRMSDMEFLNEGALRARYSYDGPLKEDRGTGKVKFVPAPADADEFLGVWLKRRRLQGAGPDDLVFPFVSAKPQNRKRRSAWTGFRKEYLEDRWDEARSNVNETAPGTIAGEMTLYHATRHSFVTRNLVAGASLDEVSVAVGHSSPVVTRRFYDQYVRRKFSATLTAKLSPG